MLRSILTTPLLLLYFISYSQNKEIEVNSHLRYTVPEGKVLELTNAKFYKIILSDGVFRSGSSCNAITSSNPKYIYGISYYENIEDKRRPKTIGFTFKEIKHNYDDVYQIKPHFLLKEDMDTDDVARSLNLKFQTQRIVFYPGMTVFPSSCIRSILLTERNMTAQENAFYNKNIKSKRLEVRKAEEESKEDEKQKTVDLENQRFNDLKYVYQHASIANSSQIRFSDTIVPAITKCLALKLNDLMKDDYENLVDEIGYASPVFIIGTWDSEGNIQTLKIIDERQYNKSKYYEINLLINDENTDKLKALLKLKASPLIKLNNNSRACFLEADLFALKIQLKAQERFSFKKTNKKFIYQPGFDSKNKELFERLFKEKYPQSQVGDYKLNLRSIEYKFITNKELFLESKESSHRQILIIQ